MQNDTVAWRCAVCVVSIIAAIKKDMRVKIEQEICCDARIWSYALRHDNISWFYLLSEIANEDVKHIIINNRLHKEQTVLPATSHIVTKLRKNKQ